MRLSGLPVRPCSLSPDGLSGCSMSLRRACLTFSPDDVAVVLGEGRTGRRRLPASDQVGRHHRWGVPRDHLRGPTTALATPPSTPTCPSASLWSSRAPGRGAPHTCETDVGPHPATPLAPCSGPVGCRAFAGRPPSSLVHPRTAAQVPLATQRTGWTGRSGLSAGLSLRACGRLPGCRRGGARRKTFGVVATPCLPGPRGSSFSSGSAGDQGTDLG